MIADTGGRLGASPVTVQRTLLTGRSIEFDAIVVADGRISTPKTDLMISEAFRHAKALGAWGSGTAVLEHAGCPPAEPGIVTADDPAEVITQVAGLLAGHRVWERLI